MCLPLPRQRALFAHIQLYRRRRLGHSSRYGESTNWTTTGDYYRGPFQLAVDTDLG